MTQQSSQHATPSDADEPAPSWHSRSVDEVMDRLQASSDGLEKEEVARRLETYGRNALRGGPRKSAWMRFLQQFNNLLIYVLIAAAAVTAMLGHPIDTGVILGVVVINAIIGFIQEGRAEAALEAIRGMISPRASVLRDGGQRLTIDAAEVVPGDVLIVEAGDRVAADVRVIKARNLRIDEAILTGESVSTEKQNDAVEEEAALGDRRSMAFSGTLVTSGQGMGVVVATGTHSELGRISGMLSRVERLETPLIRQMNTFARQLTLIVLGLSAITFAFAVLVRGYAMTDAFMAMVAMAVAAIPEGLPAVMTITLAIGVQRMAARNAIIRRLPAVETLGSVSVICSDKTGTLTRNEMMVTKVVLAEAVYDVGGEGYAPKGGVSLEGREFDPADSALLVELGQAAVLCNDAALHRCDDNWISDGDPMEGALVALGAKLGHDRGQLARTWPRLDEIPFDSAHRFMATLHRGRDGGTVTYVKGAPERLLDMCKSQATPSGEAPLDRDFWNDVIDRLACDGQRVLGLARKTPADDARNIALEDVADGMAFIGLVGLIDPPRAEAIEAVRECGDAGIAVKMITGDHAATAAAIAGQLGLAKDGPALTGQDIDSLEEGALAETVHRTSVFARTSPEHKLRLVEALQAEGAVIAMTGDGVNDAPALKRADVGVAMGRNGTEAAKEASEVVLADDNFASIVAAVREGRTVYDNLMKVIGWTLPTNGGETLIIVAAILFGLTTPITPVQILWINMVTAVALGLVLAFEPAEPNIMRRAPRAPDEPLLSPLLLWRVGFVSLLFAIGAFGMFAWSEARGLSTETARTIVVNTVVVMEIFYLFSVRYLHGASVTWRGMLGTPAVLIGVGGIVVLQLVFTYAPFMQILFQTRAVAFADGLVILAVGVALFMILELEKFVRRRLFARDWLGRALHRSHNH